MGSASAATGSSCPATAVGGARRDERAPQARRGVEEVGGAEVGPDPVADEEVGAERGPAADRAGHGQDLAAQVGGPPGRAERAALRGALDDDDRLGERRDDAVAAREAPAPAAPQRRRPRRGRTRSPRCGRGAGGARRGSRRRSRSRGPRPCGRPPWSAPRWAAPSMPRAMPLTTVIPAAARSAAMSWAVSMPPGVARREPTTATHGASGGGSVPRTHSAAGGVSRCSRRSGQPGAPLSSREAPAVIARAPRPGSAAPPRRRPRRPRPSRAGRRWSGPRAGPGRSRAR